MTQLLQMKVEPMLPKRLQVRSIPAYSQSGTSVPQIAAGYRCIFECIVTCMFFYAVTTIKIVVICFTYSGEQKCEHCAFTVRPQTLFLLIKGLPGWKTRACLPPGGPLIYIHVLSSSSKVLRTDPSLMDILNLKL